jgi:hypothetical protein
MDTRQKKEATVPRSSQSRSVAIGGHFGFETCFAPEAPFRTRLKISTGTRFGQRDL